jgi:hypothetical protein
MLAMNIRPHIIHVVGFSEAEHAATPGVVIESCKIVRGVIRSVLDGSADAKYDPNVTLRKNQLISEARYLLDFIVNEYGKRSPDPLSDADVLTGCVKRGILDAPHILKRGAFTGNLKTRMSGGKCLAYDPQNGRFLSERERLNRLSGGKDVLYG